jgi:hypothetical protein
MHLIFMNTLSAHRRPLLQMSALRLLIFLAGGIFLFGGCDKKPAPTETTAVGQNNNSAPEQIPANNPGPAVGSGPRVVPVAVAASAGDSAKLAQLTQVLRRFGVEHRRVPQSLNEVVAAGYLAALPAAPAGKQFAIDGKHMQVVLENK